MLDLATEVSGAPAPAPADAPAPLGRSHARRLREIYRPADWPCQDVLEIEMLAGGMMQRVAGPLGQETLCVTDAVAYAAGLAFPGVGGIGQSDAGG